MRVPKADEPEPAAPRRSSRLKSPEPQRTNGINGFTSTAAVSSKPQQVVEEDESPTKKQKKTASSSGLMNGRTPPSVTIEEVEDVHMPSPKPSSIKVTRPAQVIEPDENPQPRQRSQSPTSSTSPTSPVRNPFGLKSSAPKAPSKLRYSIQVEGESDKGEEDDKMSSNPAPSFASFMPPAPSTSFSPSPVASVSPSPPVNGIASTSQPRRGGRKTEAEIKASVIAMAISELPSFTFTSPTSSPGAGPGPSSQKSRDAAKAAALSSLPSYDFSARSLATPSHSAPAPVAKPSVGFDYAAAGMKPPAPSGDKWECPTCMLKNLSEAAKCESCQEPQPKKSVLAPAATGFDWDAAGMKKPEASGWTCSTCMLVNEASDTKCCSCESDAPDPQ